MIEFTLRIACDTEVIRLIHSPPAAVPAPAGDGGDLAAGPAHEHARRGPPAAA